MTDPPKHRRCLALTLACGAGYIALLVAACTGAVRISTPQGDRSLDWTVTIPAPGPDIRQ